MSILDLKASRKLSKAPLHKSYLAIDDTSLPKPFANAIASTCYGYNSIFGTTIKGLNIVTTVWSNGDVTIPLSYRIWVSSKVKEIMYKTKPLRNQKYMAIQGSYKSIDLYFAMYKRKAKQGKIERAFIVSNMKLPAKEYIDVYNGRWVIEKLFRTLKQSLGVGQGQSQDGLRQQNHIIATFLAYSVLEVEKISSRKKSPEEALRGLRAQMRHPDPAENTLFMQGF